MKNPPLLVFADDWGRHPSELSAPHPAIVGPIRGHLDQYDRHTRAKLDLATIRRGFGKIRQWFQKVKHTTEPLPNNLRVINPKMWPWFTRSVDRRINRKLLRHALLAEIHALPEPPIAITTLPIVADLMNELPVRSWVYYCVDDFSQWPGLDRKTMGRMETTVVQSADVVIAASEKLQERLWTMGRASEFLTHGVDVGSLDSECGTRDAGCADAPHPAPRILFWGVIDRRMDTEFLRQLANDLKEGTILLAGPEQQPDPELRGLPCTIRLGSVPFADLPALAQQSSVLVMPYADLPVTRAMQPLKLKEYLATGLPVVVRNLPANRDWADCLDLVDSPQAFSAMVRLRLRTGLPESQRAARQRLAAESWAAKSARFEELILSCPRILAKQA